MSTKNAEVISVIRTVSVTGKGVEGDPVREIMQYWSLDGKLLAVVDDWKPFSLKEDGKK